MKICIPVKENNGLQSIPYNHFGSAPLFLIFDSEKNEIKAVENGDLNHEHGMCQPIKAISGEAVDAVLVGGIGAGAIRKLNDSGIKVYQAAGATLSENVELFMKHELAEFSTTHCCSHHDCKH